MSNLHYVDRGEGDPVILIHGFGTRIATWDYVLDDLATRRRVIAIDLLGSGDSPKPRDANYSMMAHAERVVELLDSLGIEQCSLVGHSMGGGIALYVSLILGEQERPELVTDLVLIDSVAYPQSLPCFIRSLRFPVVSRIGAWAVPPRTQARIGQREVFYNDHAIPEELIGLYAEPLFHADGRHAILSTARHITPNNADDLVAQIPHIRIPVTIIWGEEDSVVPLSNGERLHQDIEHSTFHIIPECGHAPQEEKPQETLGILREHYSNCKKSRPN